jgi:hypothetical protein
MAAGLVLTAILVGAGGASLRWVQKRPRVVIEQRVYRSGQPSPGSLRRAVERLGLCSVVNLRGTAAGSSWFVREAETTRQLDLRLINLRFESFDWPPRREVRQLVQVLTTACEPILLHCKAGLHRTGWASGLVLAADGQPMTRVRDELATVRRSVLDSRPDYGTRFFDLYERWLERTGRSHHADVFREWALEVYCPPPYEAAIELTSSPDLSEVVAGARLVIAATVTNRSHQPWTLSSDPGRGIRLGAAVLGPFDHWPEQRIELFRRRGRPGRDVGRAGVEDGTLAPGGTRVFELSMHAPGAPGRYLLHLDMVDEAVHWFSDLGTEGVVLELTVVPSAGSS